MTGPRPLELPMFAVIKVSHGELGEEGDGQHHAQSGKDHIVHHGLDLAGGVRPCLLHRAGHIPARCKSRYAEAQGQRENNEEYLKNALAFMIVFLL